MMLSTAHRLQVVVLEVDVIPLLLSPLDLDRVGRQVDRVVKVVC